MNKGLMDELNKGAYRPVKRTGDLWGDLGVGGYSALNSVGFGLPDMVVKLANQDAYKNILKSRLEHPEANMVGDIAGMGASMFIPGGGLLKLAQGGAKLAKAGNVAAKLGKLADFAGGTTQLAGKSGLVNAIGRGALQGAEQAVPRFAAEAVTTGDAGEAAKGAALSTLGGGVVGGAAHGIGKVLGKALGTGDTMAQFAAKEGKEMLAKSTLANAGIESRGLKRAAESMGLRSASSKTRSGGDYVTDLADYLNKKGIKGKREFEAMIDQNNKAWQDVDDAFVKNAPPDWNKQLAGRIAEDPGIAETIGDMASAEAPKHLEAIGKMIGNTGNVASVRSKLGNIIRNNLSSPNAVDREKAQLAMAVKGKFDEMVADASGMDVASIKQDYKMLQPFVHQEARDVFDIPKIAGGSPTFEKGAIAKALAGSGGAGTMSAITDAAQGNDVDWGKAGLASLGGAIAPKIIAGAANKGLAALGRQAYKAMPAVEGALAKEPGKIAQFLGQAKNTGALGGQLPEAMEAGKEAGEAKDILNQFTPEEGSPISLGDGGQESPEESKPTVSEAFQQRILNKLVSDYQENGLADQGVSLEDFVNEIAEKTNGFDPEKSVGILTSDPKERAALKRDIASAKALQSIDLKAAGNQGILGLGVSDEDKLAAQNLRGIFESALTNQGEKGLTKDAAANLQGQIKTILGQDIPDQKKRAMLMDLAQNNYGIDIGRLRDMGVI